MVDGGQPEEVGWEDNDGQGYGAGAQGNPGASGKPGVVILAFT